MPDSGSPPSGLQVSTEESCVKVDPAAPADPNACGSIGIGVNHLEAHEVSMARFAEALTRAVDRQVINKTGRTENFNISLRCSRTNIRQYHRAMQFLSLQMRLRSLPLCRNSSVSNSNRARLLSTFW